MVKYQAVNLSDACSNHVGGAKPWSHHLTGRILDLSSGYVGSNPTDFIILKNEVN